MENKARLLVIDDEAGLLKLVRRQAERRGIEVIEAETGRAGLDAAIAESPQLILLDLHLPDMSGLKLLQALKADPRTTHIPVVAWSGGDVEVGSQLMGVCAYFDKADLRQVFDQIFALMPK